VPAGQGQTAERLAWRLPGPGETSESEASEPDAIEIDFGETLSTAEGTAVGTVRGLQEGGVFVTIRDSVEALSVEHVRSGQAWGMAELMWRCMECGEMGETEGNIPEGCPSRDRPRENLMYWTED